MKLYQFKTNLSRLEYQEIAFNNAYAGFNKDYSRFEEFIDFYNIHIEYQIGKTAITRTMFDGCLNMSFNEIRQYFKTWSAKKVPKPKRKKKVS